MLRLQECLVAPDDPGSEGSGFSGVEVSNWRDFPSFLSEKLSAILLHDGLPKVHDVLARALVVGDA